MALKTEYTFDKETYRQHLNGFQTVMHCHHYMSLTTKLAEDYKVIGGPDLLADAAEEAVLPMFVDYIKKNGVGSPADKLNVGREYYSVMGMGLMQVTGSDKGGEVTLAKSHVDQGWVKKWGAHTASINHFTRGFIAAMFSAAFDKPAHSFVVKETASIVKGDSASKFVIEPK